MSHTLRIYITHKLDPLSTPLAGCWCLSVGQAGLRTQLFQPSPEPWSSVLHGLNWSRRNYCPLVEINGHPFLHGTLLQRRNTVHSRNTVHAFPSFPHAHCSSNESTVHVSKHRSLSYARRGTVAPKKILFIRENTPATAAAFDMWSPRFLDRSLPLHAPNERRLFFSMHVR